MRVLYYVPMIHSDEELNEVGSILRDLKIKVYGEEAAKRDEMQMEQLWEDIRSWVIKTIGNAEGLIIYQDGMPVGPREKIHALFHLIFAEHPHSPFFRFTKELLDAGAILEGTEDLNLVIKRAAMYQEMCKAVEEHSSPQEIHDFLTKKVEEQDGLVLQADQFIARRIDETLPENGKGIVFMGYLHKVDRELVNMREANLLHHPIEIIKLGLILEEKPHG